MLPNASGQSAAPEGFSIRQLTVERSPNLEPNAKPLQGGVLMSLNGLIGDGAGQEDGTISVNAHIVGEGGTQEAIQVG